MKKKNLLRRVTIKEHLFNLTCGHLSFLILKQVIYLSEKTKNAYHKINGEYFKLEDNDVYYIKSLNAETVTAKDIIVYNEEGVA